MYDFLSVILIVFGILQIVLKASFLQQFPNEYGCSTWGILLL